MPILFVEHSCKRTVVGEMWGRVRGGGKRRAQRAGMGGGRLPRPFRQWRTLSFSLRDGKLLECFKQRSEMISHKF